MITQTDLVYFLELCNTSHLTRAAERLGITQPALSHCLKRLEIEIGTPLMLRSKKGMRLTPAGEKLRQSTAELIRKWEEVRGLSLDEVNQAQGVIRLGCLGI